MKKRVLLFLICLGFAIPSFASEGVFDYGFYLRLRQEYAKNVFDYNKEDLLKNDNYFRLKTSVWGRWNLAEDANLFVKLTTEPKY